MAGKNYDFDLGIIGAGAAGLTVAAGAAQLGAKTLLVEKEPRLGGDCLHHGCVPSKTLIKTARVRHLLRRSEAFGLPPVDAGPVDFSRVADRIRQVISTIQAHDSVERFCGLGARVEFGTPVFTDEHAVRLDGRTVSARNWVLATGSSPSVPPVKGLDRTEYLTNKNLFSLPRLPGSMIVLGGGPIAIEMAQAFNRLGTEVTVVQRSGRVLSREDPDMADEVMAVLAGEGVRFRLGASLVEVREAGSMKEVVVRDSDGRESVLRAEQVLAALGRRANTAGLGLEEIGVEVEKGAVKVDNRLRTSHKHIFAAGDVTGAYQFTHAAGYEGGIVVANAVFRLPRRTDYKWLPWCTYTDPELASIGFNETRAREAGLEYSVWEEAFRDNDRGLTEGEAGGRVKMTLDAREKPIGVQILGLHAGDLLTEWVAALNGGLRLATLAAAVHPYPTLGEINKRLAGRLISKKIFSDRVRKGLKLFFHLKGRACELPGRDQSPNSNR
ncbi:MAG: FAD-dependent oxidoreductase [Proteobacteria bacterium]|nr:FAD-dependent oxidoreductase [Pseudomonadota bacterium]